MQCIANSSQQKKLAQRAHANFLENLPPYLVCLLVAGLRFPVAAGAMGAVWSVARAWYARGYVGTGPKGRLR